MSAEDRFPEEQSMGETELVPPTLLHAGWSGFFMRNLIFLLTTEVGREQAAPSLQPHTRSCRAHNRVASAGIFQERLHLGVTYMKSVPDGRAQTNYLGLSSSLFGQ